MSFIVPVRNDAARLERCLRSISANQKTRPTEVVVCDNGSTDDSPAVARAAGATLLELPGRRVSEMRNAGAAVAQGEYLAFVDSDHEISPAWVEAALRTVADETVGAAGALYSSPPNGTWVQRSYGLLRGSTRGRHDVDWLGSGNLVVRRRAFEQVDGFDTGLEACEDVDLCKRLRAAGWRIVADEDLHSLHLGDPATLSGLFRAERWRGRNNIRVSLRPPRRMADIISFLIPVTMLAALVALVVSVGIVLSGRPGWPLGAAALAVIAGVTGLKVLRAGIRAGRSVPAVLFPLSVVVFIYEFARAAALVSRAGHHRR